MTDSSELHELSLEVQSREYIERTDGTTETLLCEHKRRINASVAVVVYIEVIKAQHFATPCATDEANRHAFVCIAWCMLERKTGLNNAQEITRIVVRVSRRIPTVLDHFMEDWRRHLRINKRY